MKRLIYQVCVGKAKHSKLYKHCIDSVKKYCKLHGIDHKLQSTPILKITPDPFTTNRSEASVSSNGGFLPIYEKENAFDLLDDYDQIGIIDADIYIKPNSPNVFDDMDSNSAFAASIERDMPLTQKYVEKIILYSKMQYANLHSKQYNFNPNARGYEFYNMGMIIINCEKFKPYLGGQTAKQFLNRMEFKPFVDGLDGWKWSTDQTLLNFFLKKYKVNTQKLDWKWNGLFTANTKINQCHFVHFFLKDKLPNRGENVKELMELI
jgi:hypothetical protein